MSNLGQIIVVDVDPTTNGGLDQAPAIVTGEYPDGSLRLRVLRASGDLDSVRNYTDETGAPFHPVEAPAGTDASPAAANAPTTATTPPATSDPAVGDALAAIEDTLTAMRAELDQYVTTPPAATSTSDTTSDTSSPADTTSTTSTSDANDGTAAGDSGN